MVTTDPADVSRTPDSGPRSCCTTDSLGALGNCSVCGWISPPDDGADRVSVSHITDDMVARGAKVIADLYDEEPEPSLVHDVLSAALAECTVDPAEEKLEAYDANALNVVAGSITDLYGFLPLNVRYQAAAAALRIANEWQAGSQVGDQHG